MRARLSAASTLAFLGFVSCAEPTAPEISVVLDPSNATVTALLTRQFSAVVNAASNGAVTWSVQEGAPGGTVSGTGLYTAPAAAGSYHVIATSVADATKSDTATVAVVDPPVITAFTVTKATISNGSATTLSATFTGGAGTINQGIGAVTSATPIPTGSLAATRTYMLRVANLAGTEDTAEVTVTVVPLPTLTSFSASPVHIATGNASQLTAVFANGTATLTPGSTALTTGVAHGTGALTTTTQYRVVVKNAADDSVFATTTVNVYMAPPAINSFTASPLIITVGDSTTLAWNVDSALSLSIDGGIGAVTGTSRKVLPGGSTSYEISATNPVGTTTATASVTVVFAPTIQRFNSAPSVVAPGGATMLRANYQQGTGVVDLGVGAVASGDSISTGPLAAAATYTLTVTNAAGRTVTRTATVGVDPGVFTATGSMTSKRRGHALVPLADGTVLALGGEVGSGGSGALNTAETFDPATGVWTATGNMQRARATAYATLLADGRVLVVGGYEIGGPTVVHIRAVEIYDPQTRTFALTDSMDVTRGSPSLHTMVDGRVLMFGGWAPQIAAPVIDVSAAEIYDPRTGVWSSTGSTGPAKRHNAFSFSLANGNVLVIGGGNCSCDGHPIEIYDRALGLFGPAPGVTAGSVQAVRLTDGSVLATGRQDNGKRWTNGTVTSVANGVRLRAYTQATVLLPNGRVLVQSDTGQAGNEGHSEAELFNPATNTFALTTRPLTSRSSARAALLRNGRALLVGGTSSLGVLETAELFDFGGATSVPVPSTSITAPGAVVANATGVSISVSPTVGARYIWQVSGGTVTSGLGTNAITITAGASGTVVVRVLVTSDLGIPASGSADIPITP